MENDLFVADGYSLNVCPGVHTCYPDLNYTHSGWCLRKRHDRGLCLCGQCGSEFRFSPRRVRLVAQRSLSGLGSVFPIMHPSVVLREYRAKRLLLCQVDGVLAYVGARAQSALDTYMDFVPFSLPQLRTGEAALESPVYWQSFYSSDLVATDIPINGVQSYLARFSGAGYQVVLCAARPQHMQMATYDWLSMNSFLLPDALLMNPTDADGKMMDLDSEIAMVAWLLVSLYQCSELVFIWSSSDVIWQVRKYVQSLCPFRGYTSLADAVAGLNL